MTDSSEDDWFVEGRQTDLNWALQTNVAKPIRNRSKLWQFGDEKELRKKISFFVKHTSLHGIRSVCSKNNKACWLKRWLYKLLFVSCVFSAFVSITILLQTTLSTQSVYISTTRKDSKNGIDEDEFFPEYPQITLCRRPGYKILDNSTEQELLEYAFLALGHPFSSITPKEVALMVDNLLYSKEGKPLTPEMQEFQDRMQRLSSMYEMYKASRQNFNITQYLLENSVKCEDIFIQCIAFVFPVPCCRIFHPVLTPLGNCFRLMLSEDMLQLKKKSTAVTFFYTFDLHAAPQIDKALDIGYEVHLSDPRNRDNTISSPGLSLVNGYSMIMRTRLTKTSRIALYTPWHGLSNDCPKLEPELDPLGFEERYFKDACVNHFVYRLMIKRCGCRPIADMANKPIGEVSDYGRLTRNPMNNYPKKGIHDASIPQCGMVEFYCVLEVALSQNWSFINQQCVPPCIEYHYKSETNLVDVGQENMSRLIFIYEGIHYSFEEYKLTTISGFLSQIGGALGLYLGASIITALEVITFLTECLWLRFHPHKRVSSVPESKKKTRNKELYYY